MIKKYFKRIFREIAQEGVESKPEGIREDYMLQRMNDLDQQVRLMQ